MVGRNATGLGCVVDHDAGVHCHGTAFINDEGVDVHLAQLGQFAHHFRNPQQHLLQRLQVHCGQATPFAQCLGDAGAFDQPVRQELVEWRQFHGAVVNQFDHGAACAKGNYRAEGGVSDHADIDFAAALGAGHVLHRHPVDARLRLQPGHGLHHVVVRVAHGRGVGDVQCHALYVGLVADVGRVDLQSHGKTQLGGNHHRLVGRTCQHGLGDRDVKRRQQCLGLHLGQHLAPFGQRAFDHQPRAFDIGLGQRGQGRRRLLQKLLVLVERSQVAKGAHRRLGCTKARDCGFL